MSVANIQSVPVTPLLCGALGELLSKFEFFLKFPFVQFDKARV